jgi:hypothetical protein
MFARHYAAQTLDEHKVVQTEAEMIPDWLRPLLAATPKNMNLPLWRFVLQPNQRTEPIPEQSTEVS